MHWTRALLLVVVAAGSAATPAIAHHAFSSEFDAKKPVKLAGRLTRMEWVNPHCWIHVAVKQPNGKEETWMIEAGTPNVLLRRGFTRKSLEIGTQIIVDGYRSKDGTLKANGRDVTFPDGRKLFLGSSGTGAPNDGRDPNQRKK